MISGQPQGWEATFEEESTKKHREDNIISFSDDDIRRIQTFHNDAIIVSVMIANYDVKRILVNNRSSIDLLFYPIFFQIRLSTINRLAD